MAAQVLDYDWGVTPEKVQELVRRIVATADPLQIILFGSWARGDYRADSDLDLAVILDAPEQDVLRIVPYTLVRGIDMSVDMIAVSRAKYDQHRPWLNSVFNYIDREGIILYDREHPERARPDAVHVGSGRRVDAHVSAA